MLWNFIILERCLHHFTLNYFISTNWLFYCCCFLIHFIQSHNIFLWAEKSTSRVEWRQVVLSNFQSGETRTGPGKITYWICSIKQVGSWHLTNAPPSPFTSHFIKICCPSLEIIQTQSVLQDPFWDQTGITGFYFPSLANQKSDFRSQNHKDKCMR